MEHLLLGMLVSFAISLHAYLIGYLVTWGYLDAKKRSVAPQQLPKDNPSALNNRGD